jgi:peptide deformylase
MDIVYYPDPVLRRRAEASGRSPADLIAFVDGMIDAMVEARGVGLAAPQVGEGLRLFVASETGSAEDAVAFLDPRIEPFGPFVEMEEGCLSLPGIRADIRRPESVRVTYTDLEGVERTEEFHELMARIIQHEYDHLDGILFFERMSETDRLRIRPDLAALEDQYVPR